MGILDSIMSIFKGKPMTREELFAKKRVLRQKRDEARLALEKEQAKDRPDMLAVDRNKRILCVWEMQLEKINGQIKRMQ